MLETEAVCEHELSGREELCVTRDKPRHVQGPKQTGESFTCGRRGHGYSTNVNEYEFSEREELDVTRDKPRHVLGPRNTGECFTCGRRGHGYLTCPERCSICGKRGHKTINCYRYKPKQEGRPGNFRRRDSDNVLVVGIGEDAVVIQVQIGKRTVSALIDTGAKPCVMDRKTLRNLQLGAMMVDAPNQVYCLCNVPVKVLGYIDTEIQLGDRPPLVQRIQILDSEDPTISWDVHSCANSRKLCLISNMVVLSLEKTGKTWMCQLAAPHQSPGQHSRMKFYLQKR